AVGYVTGCVALGAFATDGGVRRPSRALLFAAATSAALLVGLLYFVPLRPGVVDFSWRYSAKLGTARLDDVVDWHRLGGPIGPLVARVPRRTFLLCHDGYALAGLASFCPPGRPPVFLWESAARNGAAYDEWKAASDLRGWSAVIVDDHKTAGFLDRVR